MSKNESKNCPYCDEEISINAMKYRHCKSFIDDNSINILNDDKENNRDLVRSSDNKRDKGASKLSKLYSSDGAQKYLVGALIVSIVIGVIFLTYIENKSSKEIIADDNKIVIRYDPDKKNETIFVEEIISPIDGSTYTGEIKNRIPYGFGTLVFSNGSTYKGDFVNGEYEEQGYILIITEINVSESLKVVSFMVRGDKENSCNDRILHLTS